METTDLKSILPDADVIYMTRVQKERFANLEEYELIKDCYRLDASMLTETKPTLKILHPLPRNQEIAVDVDQDFARAAYFAKQTTDSLSAWHYSTIFSAANTKLEALLESFYFLFPTAVSAIASASAASSGFGMFFN